MQLPTLLLDASGRHGVSETHLVVLVLALLVVAVALLSYFVVAPEYEKRLEKHYAAALAAHHDYATRNPLACSSNIISNNSSSASLDPTAAERYLALTHKKITKHRSLGTWDIEAASSDDDAYDHHVQRLLRGVSSESEEEHATPSAAASAPGAQRDTSGTSSPPLSMNAALRQSLTEAQRQLLARRRKSESDALKHANVNRAEMLRRRVLLKKLEEEIKGAIKDTDVATSSAPGASNDASSVPSSLRSEIRRGSNDALVLTEDKLRMLQEHPAECPQELSILATTRALGLHTDVPAETQARVAPLSPTADPTDAEPSDVKQALQTMHDVLSFYLSTDHRDMHKLTVFCNSLLKHDGLNHLRAFEMSVDQDVRTLANAIIEKAVPAIWH